MNVDIKFDGGSCYFNGFNSVNDCDGITKKSGVECYNFNLVGAFLSLFGISNKIEYMLGKQMRCAYVQNKDFKKWTDRHISYDHGLNVKLVKQTLLEKKIHEVINVICKNHKINQKLKFEYDIQSKHLMESAEIEFEKHSAKKLILEEIKNFLMDSFDKIENDISTKTIFFKHVIPQIGHTWDNRLLA